MTAPTDKLKTVTKISRAKGAEVHKLQSEYIQSNTQSLRQGIFLNHSYTDEMQTLKDMVKRKDTELQWLLLGQKKRESERVIIDSV